MQAMVVYDQNAAAIPLYLYLAKQYVNDQIISDQHWELRVLNHESILKGVHSIR